MAEFLAKTAFDDIITSLETLETNVETIYDNFDDRYLGAKSSDPTVDNDGDALIDGAIYFNTTSNTLRFYDLGNTTWIDPVTGAESAQTAAETAQTGAETALDTFDDTYLGSKASDPATDNDGDALQEGAIYWNSVDKELKVWNGTNWIQQTGTSITGVKTDDVELVATDGQTTFNVTYTVGQIWVLVNGAKLKESDYTATNGTTVVLDTGVSADDVVTVVKWDSLDDILGFLGFAYQIRVYNDSGELKSTAKTQNYFLDVAESLDPTTLYASFAGMKTSDDSGREVVDKLYDLSGNGNDQAFAGADRPEYYRTLGGFDQVAVEKESENLFLNSATLSTQDVTVTADPYTVTFEGTGTITFTGDYSGSLVGVSGERVELTFTPTAGTLTCTVSGTVSKAQIEQSEYATLYIPTSGTTVTRLAPASVIENALPETGTVAGVVEAMRDSGSSGTRIFENAIDSNTRFNLNANGALVITVGGLVANIDVNAFAFFPVDLEFNKIAFLITYSASEVKTYGFFNGEIATGSATGSLATFNKDVTIGTNRFNSIYNSVRFEAQHWNDSTVRVNATDDEIKAFFEQLTQGTSMETLAENMTIV